MVPLHITHKSGVLVTVVWVRETTRTPKVSLFLVTSLGLHSPPEGINVHTKCDAVHLEFIIVFNFYFGLSVETTLHLQSPPRPTLGWASGGSASRRQRSEVRDGTAEVVIKILKSKSSFPTSNLPQEWGFPRDGNDKLVSPDDPHSSRPQPVPSLSLLCPRGDRKAHSRRWVT